VIEAAVLVKRVVVLGVVSTALVCLVYRGYMAVDEQTISVLPLVLCLLFGVSVTFTILAWYLGDGMYSGLRQPD
jgi:hypothetical protein